MRAPYLERNNRRRILPAAGATFEAATYTKWLIFASVCFFLIGFIPGADKQLLIRAIAAALLGYMALLLWDAWRARGEQREMAFEAWMDHVVAIARNYNLEVIEHHPKWRERFRARMTAWAAMEEESLAHARRLITEETV